MNGKNLKMKKQYIMKITGKYYLVIDLKGPLLKTITE